MSVRNFANAPATTLDSGCTATDTTMTVSQDPGFPAPPFTIIVDYGQPTEEGCLCTSKSGTTLTVSRGFDGTTAFAHTADAGVYHGVLAIDPREANLHVNSDSDVHGVSGALVGTDNVQTLTNKTLAAPVVNNATVHGPLINSGKLTNQSQVWVDPNTASVPLQIVDATGAVIGSITRSGTVQAPQFQGGKGNNWASFIAYADPSQSASGFVVRRNDETPVAGIDASGNVFGTNLAPGNATIAPYAYYSKGDADSVAPATWEKLEFYTPDQKSGTWVYSNGYWTVPSGGRWRIMASAGFATGSSSGSRGIRIMTKSIGGALAEQARCIVGAGTASGAGLQVVVSKPIPAGYQVYVEVWQSSGGNLGVGGALDGPCLFQIEWIGLT